MTLTRRGGNCECTPTDLAIVERVSLALADGRLQVYSQPIVHLATGDEVSEELLVRIVTEDGEVLRPAEFLPAAEKHGLMPKIDRLVIECAARVAASGRFVHVNLSATTIRDFTVFGDILTAVHVHRAEPTRLTFEITETAAAASMEDATRLADKLRASGFHIALDDFGSGEPFPYLSELLVDTIKIDRRFVHDLGVNPRPARFVRAVVALADELGVATIAEGVEDERSLAAARALGVDCAQGFHIGRPQRSSGLDVDPEQRRFGRSL